MSVTLGALVIAISTEFSVLISERHRQERVAGRSTVEALRLAYAHTGAAVAASGVTAIAGFGVLTLSDIAMLRDFGFVTLVDLSVSLVGVLVALPAAVVLAEGEQPLMLRIRQRSPLADGARTEATPTHHPMTSGYGRYVALFGVLLVVVFTLHTVFSSHKQASGLKAGDPVPPFAAPLAIGGPRRRSERRHPLQTGTGRQTPRVPGARRQASSTSASSTNTARWCSRCSSTPVPARACLTTCNDSRLSTPMWHSPPWRSRKTPPR